MFILFIFVKFFCTKYIFIQLKELKSYKILRIFCNKTLNILNMHLFIFNNFIEQIYKINF